MAARQGITYRALHRKVCRVAGIDWRRLPRVKQQHKQTWVSGPRVMPKKVGVVE